MSSEGNAHQTRRTWIFSCRSSNKKLCFDWWAKRLLPVTTDITTYDNIQGRLHSWLFIDYPYFKEHYKLIMIDWIKQQALDTDPKAIQQISFTGNLDRDGNTTTIFFIEEPKETILYFSQGTMRVL